MTTLWQANIGLVAAVASRYRRPGIDTDDLVGVGQLGLQAAIARFDPERFPGRLSTYAVPWIRWYVQDHVSRNALPVRLPETTAHRQLARHGARLLAEARRACLRERVDPTDTDLCARVGCRIGLSADEIARWLHAGGSAAIASTMTHRSTPATRGRPRTTRSSAWTARSCAAAFSRWPIPSSANANARCSWSGA